jgi:Cysteine dioxygenase type I
MATSADRARRGIPVQHFIEGLRKLKEDDFTGVSGTLQYLRENSVDPESLDPYLFWNAQHYTRNLIDKTDLYELLAICWEVGMGSSIHNHQGTELLDGRAHRPACGAELPPSLRGPLRPSLPHRSHQCRRNHASESGSG